MAKYTLHKGDCIPFMAKMPSESVSVVISDPPYGTELITGGYSRTHKTIENDKDLSIVALAFKEFPRLIGNGYAAMFFSPRNMPEFFSSIRGVWYGHIVWNKKAPGMGQGIRYMHENIAVFQFGDPEQPTNNIFSVINALKVNAEHPHQKPVAAMKSLIEWLTNPGDIVFDPFMGSGTTGVACMELDRDFIGCELDEKHFAVAEQRIKASSNQGILFTRAQPNNRLHLTGGAGQQNLFSAGDVLPAKLSTKSPRR
jgi:site-specific DNA-methyltransferase (adenine-specific)